MKTALLLSFGLLSFFSNSQQIIDKCLSHKAIQYQESLTPGYINQVNAVFEKAKAHQSSYSQEKMNSLYTIPVVFHVVYNTAAQNIPDSVIIDQIRVLNDDYNRLNADTINMRSDFDDVAGSPRIEFRLAQIDEFGNPTSGITRTNTTAASFGSIAAVTGSFADLEKVKSTADGGIDPWDQTKYLNIWVCNMSINFFGQEITALLGYATPPDGLPHWPVGATSGLSDGVVLQFQTVGTNNPNQIDMGNGLQNTLGRTASHEVGHYLGLRHIWGDGDCTAEDGIDDTPNADAESNFDCDDTKNTCVDNILGVDLPDMIENFMDYSADDCQNSFTQGQGDLMIGVLENERYDLVHNNPASINELDVTHLTIFPNPTANDITLTHNNNISEIQLLGMYGNVIQPAVSVESGSVISLENYPAGIYFIQYVSDNGIVSSKRIVKQ